MSGKYDTLSDCASDIIGRIVEPFAESSEKEFEEEIATAVVNDYKSSQNDDSDNENEDG